MLAVLLALAAAVSFGGSDFAGGLASRRAGSEVMVTAAVAVTEAVLVICVVPFISSQFPSPGSVCWAAVGGAGGIAGLMALAAVGWMSAGPRSPGR
jgi:drug/metabolite transporter (DMT)-like permease